MRTILVITAGALTLAACQKAPAAGAASTATPAAAAATQTTAPGALPQRRAGLWQQTVSREGNQGAMAAMNAMGGMKICVDAASEGKSTMWAHNISAHGGDSHCTPAAPSRGLDGSYSFSTTCSLGVAGTMSTKGTVSGDFSSSYHVHSETDISGAKYAAMNGHHVTEIDGKWLGPCPAGMAAGDIEMGNGMRINSSKFAGAAKAMGGGQ